MKPQNLLPIKRKACNNLINQPSWAYCGQLAEFNRGCTSYRSVQENQMEQRACPGRISILFAPGKHRRMFHGKNGFR